MVLGELSWKHGLWCGVGAVNLWTARHPGSAGALSTGKRSSFCLSVSQFPYLVVHWVIRMKLGDLSRQARDRQNKTQNTRVSFRTHTHTICAQDMAGAHAYLVDRGVSKAAEVFLTGGAEEHTSFFVCHLLLINVLKSEPVFTKTGSGLPNI